MYTGLIIVAVILSSAFIDEVSLDNYESQNAIIIESPTGGK